MPDITTLPWDAAEYLENKEDIAAYLEAAFEDGNPDLIEAVLKDIARAKSINNIALESGLSSEKFSQVLLLAGNSEFINVLQVLQLLGLRLQVIQEEDNKTMGNLAGF
jgi:probable addiction module antidote protein